MDYLLNTPKAPRILVAFFIFIFLNVAAAQNQLSTKYILYLTDKGPKNVLRPYSSKNQQQTWEDTELYTPYLDELKSKKFKISLILKWLNAVSGWCTPKIGCSIDELKDLPFVQYIGTIPQKKKSLQKPKLLKPIASAKTAISIQFAISQQKSIYQAVGLTPFQKGGKYWIQKPGNAQTVAVIDNGFSLGHQGWNSLKESPRLLEQKDFVDSTNTTFQHSSLFDSHGSQVLSILAIEHDSLRGIIPYSNFLLYRSEDDSKEAHVEEDYLAKAIEQSVEKGAKVINISLGYRYDFNTGDSEHPYSYFDGTQSPASIAATKAAHRNTLVVVAMGNENSAHPGIGNLVAPADADSILSVGAMFLLNEKQEHCSFSSLGPTFDQRTKPEISAPGCPVPIIQSSSLNQWALGNGTSFAAPIVTGIATLLWQLFPNETAQGIRLALMQSGTIHISPNDSIGHGLIHMERAYKYLLNKTSIQIPNTLRSNRIHYLAPSPNQPQYFGKIAQLSPRWDIHSLQGQLLFSIDTRNKVIGDKIWYTPSTYIANQLVIIRPQ